jgi:hypothetical protein
VVEVVVDVVERLLTDEAVEKVVHDEELLELVVDMLDVVVNVVVATELEVVEVVDREVVLVLFEVEVLTKLLLDVELPEVDVEMAFAPPATLPFALTELLVVWAELVEVLVVGALLDVELVLVLVDVLDEMEVEDELPIELELVLLEDELVVEVLLVVVELEVETGTGTNIEVDVDIDVEVLLLVEGVDSELDRVAL